MRHHKIALLLFLGLPIVLLFQNSSSPETAAEILEEASVEEPEKPKKKKEEPACFSVEDNENLKFELVQAVYPPEVENGLLPEVFKHYPATGFSTQKVERIPAEYVRGENSDIRYTNYLSLWSNFCVNLDQNRNKRSLAKCGNDRKHKGNHYPKPLEVRHKGKKVEVRPIFTSYDAANYCTLAQAAHLLGYSKSTVRKYLRKGKLREFYRSENDFKRLAKHHKSVRVPFARETKQYFINLCILKKRENADPKGVFLDYEVADNRPGRVTVSFLKRMKSLLDRKGKKLIVWTNDFARSDRTGIHGLDRDNLKDVLRHVDAFGFAVHNGSDANGYESKFRCSGPGETFVSSFRKQWRVVEQAFGPRRPPGHKFLPLISLFDLNEKQAASLHREIRKKNLRGIRLWRHGAGLGGSCNEVTNKVLRCLAFGERGNWKCNNGSRRVPCGKNGLTCLQMKRQGKRCK